MGLRGDVIDEEPESHISIYKNEVILPPSYSWFSRIRVNEDFFQFIGIIRNFDQKQVYPIINRGVTGDELNDLDECLDGIAPENMNALTLYYAGEIEGFSQFIAPLILQLIRRHKKRINRVIIMATLAEFQQKLLAGFIAELIVSFSFIEIQVIEMSPDSGGASSPSSIVLQEEIVRLMSDSDRKFSFGIYSILLYENRYVKNVLDVISELEGVAQNTDDIPGNTVIFVTDQISTEKTSAQIAYGNLVLEKLSRYLKQGITGLDDNFEGYNQLEWNLTFSSNTVSSVQEFEDQLITNLIVPVCPFEYAARIITISSEIIDESIVRTKIGINVHYIPSSSSMGSSSSSSVDGFFEHVIRVFIIAFQHRANRVPEIPRFVLSPFSSSPPKKFRIIDNISYKTQENNDYMRLRGSTPTPISPLKFDDPQEKEEEKRKKRRKFIYSVFEFQRDDWKRMSIAEYMHRIFSKLKISRPTSYFYEIDVSDTTFVFMNDPETKNISKYPPNQIGNILAFEDYMGYRTKSMLNIFINRIKTLIHENQLANILNGDPRLEFHRFLLPKDDEQDIGTSNLFRPNNWETCQRAESYLTGIPHNHPGNLMGKGESRENWAVQWIYDPKSFRGACITLLDFFTLLYNQGKGTSITNPFSAKPSSLVWNTAPNDVVARFRALFKIPFILTEIYKWKADIERIESQKTISPPPKIDLAKKRSEELARLRKKFEKEKEEKEEKEEK